MSRTGHPFNPSPRRKQFSTAFALLATLIGTPIALSAQQASVTSLQPLARVQQTVTLTYQPLSFETASISSSHPLFAEAESSSSSDFPDAPGLPQDQKGQPGQPGQVNETNDPNALANNGTHQTKRILGIMPNFRSVSADTKLPPMTAKEKFIIAGKDTFDYSSFFIAAVQTTFSKSGNSYPEFGSGVVGFGRYYWHTLADTIDENFWVGGLGPVVFHQDNRFYTLGHGGFVKRTSYAWTRVLISRKDDGSKTFNFSEVIGSGAAAGISTLYYPNKYQTWTKVGQKWLTSDLIDGANFMLKEFWPDINKFLSHRH